LAEVGESWDFRGDIKMKKREITIVSLIMMVVCFLTLEVVFNALTGGKLVRWERPNMVNTLPASDLSRCSDAKKLRVWKKEDLRLKVG
jgi:hypothetical protein